ncbi:MAG: GntR family transcriptional regulator [Candidatus Eisenbacteria bacterium]
MLLNLSDVSNEPLQSQISRQIRALILAGDAPAGTMLPSIRSLARQERVSVITVQRGYENLERDGLIHSRRGKGFFVSEIRDDRRKAMARQRLIEDLGPLLRAASSEGLSAGEIARTFKATLSKKAKRKR